MERPGLAPLLIDESGPEPEQEHELRPSAPKRRRHNERHERLAGFATAAAAAAAPTPDDSARRIQANLRGHRVRSDLAQLRPSSAETSSSNECLDVPEEEIAEEEEEEMCSTLLSAMHVDMTRCGPSDAEASLEQSDLESSGDSTLGGPLATMVAAAAAARQREERGESICAICIAPMLSRRHAEGTGAGARVTLECSHKFHRRCLLSWCRQQGGRAGCPMCREEVRVRHRGARAQDGS